MNDSRNCQVAEKIMGWEIRPRPWGLLSIEDSTRFEVMIGADDMWRWKDQCNRREDGTWEVPESAPFASGCPPDYLTDKNACHEALEKMRKDGWGVTWTGWENPTENRVELFKQDLKVAWPCGIAPTFCEAAVDAMIAALGEDSPTQ